MKTYMSLLMVNNMIHEVITSSFVILPPMIHSTMYKLSDESAAIECGLEINIIRLQALKRFFALLNDMTATIPESIRVFIIHTKMGFGRKYNFIALSVPHQ